MPHFYMTCIFPAQTFPYKASGLGQFQLVYISEVVAFLWELPGIRHDLWPVATSYRSNTVSKDKDLLPLDKFLVSSEFQSKISTSF